MRRNAACSPVIIDLSMMRRDTLSKRTNFCKLMSLLAGYFPDMQIFGLSGFSLLIRCQPQGRLDSEPGQLDAIFRVHYGRQSWTQ